MKFSFTLVKKLVPAVKNKQELIEKLNLHTFEVEDAKGDVFDVSIAPNRFSDAASHWGIAREISAILGSRLKLDASNFKLKNSGNAGAPFDVIVKDKKLCPRYAAQYFENVRISSSPKWMQKILTDCGLRPINNIVDIMNYAMLETGQPLHAFDYDKISRMNADTETRSARGSARNPRGNPRESAIIIVRRAQKGEKITTLDDKTYNLSENILVIADPKRALAIAGIKGGKYAEVGKSTKRIIVEAANFEGVNIYKASKFLKLGTDASLRFSHNITSNLVSLGLNRAAELLKKVVNAKAGRIIDVNSVKPTRKIIKFDPERYERFIGVKIELPKIRSYLERLGFKISRINADNNADLRGYYKLLRAKDKEKDQSYFLWMLDQKQLNRILFPIGDYTREEVEKLAKKFKLPFSGVKKSQEICFVPRTTEDFLKKHIKSKAGAIITKEGKKTGEHEGLWFYTIGQRKGIKLPGGPYYVLDKDLKKNLLIVTKNEKDLYKNELIAKNVNWISGKAPKLPFKVMVKIRYRHKVASATMYKMLDIKYKILFNSPQRAITPGQSVVFYSPATIFAKGKIWAGKHQELLGGGIIDK